MKIRNQIWTGFLAAAAMLLFILDTKTALTGAKEGMTLCIYTVIPSLFPFIFLSMLINSSLIGKSLTVLRPLGKLCGIPAGCESLMVLGLLGGYPVGAQSISQAYERGQIDKQNAERMLGFCNNAGPAFLFGMTHILFSSPYVPWALWLIHITSAILTGCFLSGKTDSACRVSDTSDVSVTRTLERSLKTMANICGWVILFRVILSVLQRWILWLFPTELQIAVYGLTELSNGFVELYKIDSEGLRFIFAACFLSLGGLCVTMQTMSVIKGLSLKIYLKGKLLQFLFSILLAGLVQHFLFSGDAHLNISVILLGLLFCGCCSLLIYANKKSSGNRVINVV